MQSAQIVRGTRSEPGEASPAEDHAGTRKTRSGEITPSRIRFGLLSAAAVVAVQIMLISIITGYKLATSSLVALGAVLATPVVVAAALATAHQARSHAREEASAAAGLRLAHQVAHSEKALARAQERLHELRATVGGLKLMHQLLVDQRVVLPRPARWRLQRLHNAELERVERMLSPRAPGLGTVVDLTDVLDPLVDVMAVHGCAVELRGTGPFLVCGPADDLTEIVHVLLDNAARHAAARDVVLEVASRDGWVELRVQDGGPGVARALTPVLFERGSRAASSQGEGLGLHVARRLAEGLGGELWLEPRHHAGGAEFVLRIPEVTGHEPCLAAAV